MRYYEKDTEMKKTNQPPKGKKASTNFDWSDFETEAIERLQNGESFGGKDGILAPMIKRILEASLEGELSAHLSAEKLAGKSNRRNGKQSKDVMVELNRMCYLRQHDVVFE